MKTYLKIMLLEIDLDAAQDDKVDFEEDWDESRNEAQIPTNMIKEGFLCDSCVSLHYSILLI